MGLTGSIVSLPQFLDHSLSPSTVEFTLEKSNVAKDEEVQVRLEKGCRVLELYCDNCSDKNRDQLYDEIMTSPDRH